MTACSAQQIADGELISVHVDRPSSIPEGLALGYRKLPECWRWCLVRRAAAQDAPKQQGRPQAVPRVAATASAADSASAEGWWSQEVRFLQPKAQRGRYPVLATKLVVGVPIAIGAELVASRLIHTPTG